MAHGVYAFVAVHLSPHGGVEAAAKPIRSETIRWRSVRTLNVTIVTHYMTSLPNFQIANCDGFKIFCSSCR